MGLNPGRYVLKNNLPGPGPLPSTGTRASYWAAHQRRPILLLLLGVGLVLAFIWLPASVRSSFLNAFSAQRGLVFLLSLFVLLALSLIWSSGQRLDMYIFTLLNLRGYPAWLDRFIWMATQLGNMLVAFILAVLFYLLNYRLLALELILGTLSLWLLVELIKAISDRDRPFLTFEKARVIGWREKGNSFPSGHTTQVFFLATLFVHRFQLGIGASIALYAVALLVGFTRIYVGAHYPRDVLAGIVLGSFWGLLAMLVDGYWSFLH
jgi:membrane-associated phospholipid phosphatase